MESRKRYFGTSKVRCEKYELRNRIEKKLVIKQWNKEI